LRFTRSDGLRFWTGFLDLCALLALRAIASDSPSHDWDWELIVRLAGNHMATPAVWAAVEGRGFVPDEVKTYFRVIHDMNAERNAVILGGLAAAVARLQEIGIEPILLKGAASLASGLYADPAERILTDIDLLISSRQIQAAAAALRGMGYTDYTDPPSTPRWVRPPTSHHPHHIPALIHPGGIFSVEIHMSLVIDEFERLLPTAGVFAHAVAIQWNGRSVFVLHPTDRLVHNIVHAQLQDGRFSHGRVELRQMRELALLATRHGDAVDWREVEHRFSSAKYADVLAEQAALCPALLGVPLPVAAADFHETMKRLRRDPRGAAAVLAALARDYIAGFLHDPRLAVNLVNPFWWPQRIRGVRRLLRRND
jgi:hypothetical protein